jgi:hypothetical protein
VCHLAEVERQIGNQVHGSNDFENREIGDRRECVGMKIEYRLALTKRL